MYQGEDKKCFGHHQVGSRLCHQALDAMHKKTLTYNLSQIMQTALLMFDNNASGCFDWIVMSITTIAALQLAFPWSVAWMHAKALSGMKYFIKTAHGISEGFYKATPSYLLFGMGQGSGASPAIWLTIVICLLSVLMAMAPLAMAFMDP
jgi:hypothetical protein